MVMIQEIRLKNFKPFESQSFQIKPLTLLSGLNSTGKSSVLQSLLLLRQSYQQGLLTKTGLLLNGDLVSIGTAKDALFERAKEDLICFIVIWDNGNGGIWEFKYDPTSDVLEFKYLPTDPESYFESYSEFYQSSLFNDNFHYLTAERIGPRRYFEMSDYQVRQHQQIGSRGEFTAHFLAMYADDKIPNTQLSHPSANSLNLGDQVEAWIGEISPGTRIQVTPSSNMDLMSLQYSYRLSNPYRSTNVGFGVTYTLPIIVAILAASPGTLILLENPEAHLHPQGQAKMGELLALAASCGIQVIMVLNELSLNTPASDISTARQWMSELIRTLRKATSSGVKRVLRTSNDLNSLELAPSYPVARWRNDKIVDREEKRFFITLTTKAPFWTDIAEDIKDKFDLSQVWYQGELASGLGFALVIDALAVSIKSELRWDFSHLKLEVRRLDENADLIEEQVEVIHASRYHHIQEHSNWIQTRIRTAIRPGQLELQPVIKALFELQKSAQNWQTGIFSLKDYPLEESGESEATKNKYAKERSFCCPDGQERLFERHVKLRLCNWRIHFFPQEPRTLIIGYIGTHLPTVKYPK